MYKINLVLNNREYKHGLHGDLRWLQDWLVKVIAKLEERYDIRIDTLSLLRDSAYKSLNYNSILKEPHIGNSGKIAKIRVSLNYLDKDE